MGVYLPIENKLYSPLTNKNEERQLVYLCNLEEHHFFGQVNRN